MYFSGVTCYYTGNWVIISYRYNNSFQGLVLVGMSHTSIIGNDLFLSFDNLLLNRQQFTSVIKLDQKKRKAFGKACVISSTGVADASFFTGSGKSDGEVFDLSLVE